MTSWWNVPEIYGGDGLRPYAVLVRYDRDGLIIPVDFCRDEHEARNRAQKHSIRQLGARTLAIVHALSPEPELVTQVRCE